jgi:3-oxoacyl-[acyl-carrier protein] reductase
MNSNLQHNNRIVIISGATRGLGKELSLAFARADYSVIGLYRSDAESANRLLSELKCNNDEITFIRKDITSDNDWSEFDGLLKSNNNKHITLISNACAPFSPKPMHLINWQEISDQIDVTLKGTFAIQSRVLKYMLRFGSGTIINILSAAMRSNPTPKGFSAYIAAKCALEGLTRATASEYAAKGIRVFSVSPGLMQTSLTMNWSEHLKSSIIATGGSFQDPARIAQLILRLAQDGNVGKSGEDFEI